MRFFAQFK